MGNRAKRRPPPKDLPARLAAFTRVPAAALAIETVRDAFGSVCNDRQIQAQITPIPRIKNNNRRLGLS